MVGLSLSFLKGEKKIYWNYFREPVWGSMCVSEVGGNTVNIVKVARGGWGKGQCPKRLIIIFLIAA